MSLLSSYNFLLSIVLVDQPNVFKWYSFFKVLSRRSLFILLFCLVIWIIIFKVEVMLTFCWFTLFLLCLHFLHHWSIRLIIRVLGLATTFVGLLLAYDFRFITFLAIFFFLLFRFLFFMHNFFCWRRLDFFRVRWLHWIEKIAIVIFFVGVILFHSWLFAWSRLSDKCLCLTLRSFLWWRILFVFFLLFRIFNYFLCLIFSWTLRRLVFPSNGIQCISTALAATETYWSLPKATFRDSLCWRFVLILFFLLFLFIILVTSTSIFRNSYLALIRLSFYFTTSGTSN